MPITNGDHCLTQLATDSTRSYKSNKGLIVNPAIPVGGEQQLREKRNYYSTVTELRRFIRFRRKLCQAALRGRAI